MLMMLPFEAPTIFEGINKSYFRMPRVVKNQKSKFENDELFRQLSHESSVKYTGFRERPLEERQMKFIASYQEGHSEISVIQSGNQFTLMFNPIEDCNFDKESGKVHILSGFILNGVCVRWRGWIDLQRLEGFGALEFDERRANLEDSLLRQQGLLPPPLGFNAFPNIPSSMSLSLSHQYGTQQAISSAASAAFHQALTRLPPPPPGPSSSYLGPGVLTPSNPLPPPTSASQQQQPPPTLPTNHHHLNPHLSHPPPPPCWQPEYLPNKRARVEKSQYQANNEVEVELNV